MPETITVKDATARYGISRERLRQAIRAGEIKAYKPSKEILIDLESGDSWFRNSGDKLVQAGRRRKRRVA